MKMYTNIDQTAKLIELGFEKPKSISSIKVTGDIITTAEDLIGEPTSVMGGKITANYSIGELIEMLPEKITIDGWNYSRVISENEICYYFWELEVYFCICDSNIQLIDNLFDAIVRLKEEGVI